MCEGSILLCHRRARQPILFPGTETSNKIFLIKNAFHVQSKVVRCKLSLSLRDTVSFVPSADPFFFKNGN